MVGDALPPADDLNFGFDVKLVDEHTVALVPLQPPGDERFERARVPLSRGERQAYKSSDSSPIARMIRKRPKVIELSNIS